MAFLAYCVIPTHTGYSPAQLLMARQLRSTLPLTQSALKPSTPSQRTVAEKDAVAKQQQVANYDKRYRARNIPTRKQGQEVWVPDIQSRATIIETQPYRTYTLQTVRGRIIRRNARALHPLLPKHHHQQHQQHQDNSIFENSTLRMRIRDMTAPMPAPIPSPLA